MGCVHREGGTWELFVVVWGFEKRFHITEYHILNASIALAGQKLFLLSLLTAKPFPPESFCPFANMILVRLVRFY